MKTLWERFGHDALELVEDRQGLRELVATVERALSEPHASADDGVLPVAQDEAPPQILITDVNVFDGKTNGVTTGQDVLVEGNLIKEIGDDVQARGDAIVIIGFDETSQILTGLIENGVGPATVKSILEELTNPGKDPREDMKPQRVEPRRSSAPPKKTVTVEAGQELEGTVVSVADFGAFVELEEGVEGLAPYWFEVEAFAFVSEDGDVSARLEASYDMILSQRMMIESEVETLVSASDVEDLIMGCGQPAGEAGFNVGRVVANHALGDIWAMGGENQAFDDMDAIPMKSLK